LPAGKEKPPMKNHCADPKPVAGHKFQSDRDTGLLLFIKALSLSLSLSFSLFLSFSFFHFPEAGD
jgi:hypothetical protein